MASKIFEMTNGQYIDLVQACKHSDDPIAACEAEWKKLGEKMGFNYKTARPLPDKGPRFFRASVTV